MKFKNFLSKNQANIIGFMTFFVVFISLSEKHSSSISFVFSFLFAMIVYLFFNISGKILEKRSEINSQPKNTLGATEIDVKGNEMLQAGINSQNLSQFIDILNQRTDINGANTPVLSEEVSNMEDINKSELATNVRAYASIKDAINYGWEFTKKIGYFNEMPIFEIAKLNNQLYQYEGLTQPQNMRVSANQRVFGQFKYKLLEE